MADVDQLTAALQTKGANPQCVSCGRTPNWGTGEVLLHIMDEGGGGLQLGNGIAALAMICDHCGFVRLHASKTLIP